MHPVGGPSGVGGGGSGGESGGESGAGSVRRTRHLCGTVVPVSWNCVRVQVVCNFCATSMEIRLVLDSAGGGVRSCELGPRRAWRETGLQLKCHSSTTGMEVGASAFARKARLVYLAEAAAAHRLSMPVVTEWQAVCVEVPWNFHGTSKQNVEFPHDLSLPLARHLSRVEKSGVAATLRYSNRHQV